MNPKLKAAWIAALRDPNAKQASGYLGDSQGGRCCLGVFCDIAVKNNVIDAPHVVGGELIYGRDAVTTLPDEVAEWAGGGLLPNGAFSFYLGTEGEGERFSGSLSSLNDGGLTFSQIADFIEWYF